MTSALQEYSRQLIDYTRQQWNTTRRQSKRDQAREESETYVKQGVMTEEGQENRAATASALQVRVRRPPVAHPSN